MGHAGARVDLDRSHHGSPGMSTGAKPRRGCSWRGGCVNGYSHLSNGCVEACLQLPRVGDASVMLNEDMGSSGNHV